MLVLRVPPGIPDNTHPNGCTWEPGTPQLFPPEAAPGPPGQQDQDSQVEGAQEDSPLYNSLRIFFFLCIFLRLCSSVSQGEGVPKPKVKTVSLNPDNSSAWAITMVVWVNTRFPAQLRESGEQRVRVGNQALK